MEKWHWECCPKYLTSNFNWRSLLILAWNMLNWKIQLNENTPSERISTLCTWQCKNQKRWNPKYLPTSLEFLILTNHCSNNSNSFKTCYSTQAIRRLKATSTFHELFGWNEVLLFWFTNYLYIRKCEKNAKQNGLMYFEFWKHSSLFTFWKNFVNKKMLPEFKIY